MEPRSKFQICHQNHKMHYLVVEDMTIWLKAWAVPLPAVGFAAGIERLLIESLMDDKNETIDFFIGFDLMLKALLR